MKTIFRVFGLAEFRDLELTRDYIIKKYGKPDDSIDHTNYSNQISYSKLGLCFYYLNEKEDTSKEDSSKEENIKENDPKIVTISFMPPFEGKTEDKIILNKNTMADVFKTYGHENWLTSENSKYWWRMRGC